MELEQLVRAAAMGDQRAWATLAKRLTPVLLGFFVSRLAGSDYRDLVQETLVIVWKKLPDFEFRTEAAFIAWVCRIAYREACSARRRGQRTSKLARALGPVERSPSPRALSLLDRAERFEMVLGAIEKLPPAQRRAIQNLLDGGNAKELAQRLGIEWATVRGAESRGFARLREALRTPTPGS